MVLQLQDMTVPAGIGQAANIQAAAAIQATAAAAGGAGAVARGAPGTEGREAHMEAQHATQVRQRFKAPKSNRAAVSVASKQCTRQVLGVSEGA